MNRRNVKKILEVNALSEGCISCCRGQHACVLGGSRERVVVGYRVREFDRVASSIWPRGKGLPVQGYATTRLTLEIYFDQRPRSISKEPEQTFE